MCSHWRAAHDTSTGTGPLAHAFTWPTVGSGSQLPTSMLTVATVAAEPGLVVGVGGAVSAAGIVQGRGFLDDLLGRHQREEIEAANLRGPQPGFGDGLTAEVQVQREGRSPVVGGPAGRGQPH